MKLNKFKKNTKLRNTLLTLGIVSIILGGGIILYKTYALYQEKYKYNVIKGTIPNFGYDVKLAIIVDDEEKEEVPITALGKNNLYYEVDVNCASSATEGLWDYNAWKLNLDYIKSDSKCTLTFTSKLSKAEYDEYIEAGVQTRRNTYRGKDITYLKDNGNLYKQISNCTFDDIYVGDYIVSDTMDSSNKNIIWLIADINNYRYSGDTPLSECHATIIPAKPLTNEAMNTSNTTKGGYYGSNMVQKILGTEINENKDDILNKYIAPDFKGHLISYRNLLSNDMDGSRVNQLGTTGGASSNWSWYSRYLDLMSEVNVYGSVVWSSSGYDIGIDNRQYAIFQLKPEFINSYGIEMFNYWLKAVTNSLIFTSVSSVGYSSNALASGSYGVRPRFLIN